MMKTVTILLALFAISCSLTAQSAIDIERPISRIDVGYSVDNYLIFTLVLNTKENTQNLQNSLPINFKASVEGQINWDEETQDPKKKLLSAVFQSSTPFTFVAYAKDGSTALIPAPTKQNWKSIEQVKLKYELEGKYFESPYLTIFPPPVNKMETEITISSKAKMTDKKKCEIRIVSNDGTPFEVTSVDVIKNSHGVSSTSKITGEALGQSRFANSGVIDLSISTSFEIDEDATYIVSVVSKKIGTPGTIKSKPNEVVFTNEILPRILNKPSTYSILIDDKDEFTDEVRTEGKGEIGIRFLTKEFSDKIRITKENRGGGTFIFTLAGLSQLPDNSFSYYYYTVNGLDFPQPYLITKKSPVLSDFKFNGLTNNKIILEFRLPQYAKEESISINIIGKKDNLEVKGTAVIKLDPIDKSKFQVSLQNELTDMVAKDTLLDVNIIVKYKDIPLYTLGISLFNQKLLNQKISELVAETAKSGRKDKEKIKKAVEDIVKIGEAVGNSISQDEVKNAIDALSGGNKDRIKNTMTDIGKWALIAGKIVLPLLI